MKALTRSSAMRACALMNLRAWPIWPARRSVGVGDLANESSLGFAIDLAGLRTRARSS